MDTKIQSNSMATKAKMPRTNEPDSIEFRVRMNGDIRAWEDIEKTTCSFLVENNEIIKKFIDNNFCNSEIKEVRWNFKNSFQGHYVVPKNSALKLSLSDTAPNVTGVFVQKDGEYVDVVTLSQPDMVRALSSMDKSHIIDILYAVSNAYMTNYNITKNKELCDEFDEEEYNPIKYK